MATGDKHSEIIGLLRLSPGPRSPSVLGRGFSTCPCSRGQRQVGGGSEAAALPKAASPSLKAIHVNALPGPPAAQTAFTAKACI